MKTPAHDYKTCIDCGICYEECKFEAIEFVNDEAGFQYAKIKEHKCVNCNQCERKCIANNKLDANDLKKIESFAGKYKNAEERKKSTSGGFCDALARTVISDGGFVFGVSYNDTFQETEYLCIDDLNDLEKIRGVKYSQSNRVDIRKVLEKVETGKKVLFVGLPCQVSALKTWLQEKYDNIYFVALVCHGPTSQKIERKFINEHSKNPEMVVLRKYMKGKSYLFIKNKNGTSYKKIWEDTSYFKAFNIINRESCYSCSYKLDSLKADVLVGDYWGLEDDKEFYSHEGNCAIIFLTNRWGGSHILDELKNFEYKKKDIDDIIIRNRAIVSKTARSIYRDSLVKLIETYSLDDSIKKVIPLKKRLKDKLRNILIVLLPKQIIRTVRKGRKRK